MQTVKFEVMPVPGLGFAIMRRSEVSLSVNKIEKTKEQADKICYELNNSKSLFK